MKDPSGAGYLNADCSISFQVPASLAPDIKTMGKIIGECRLKACLVPARLRLRSKPVANIMQGQGHLGWKAFGQD